MLLQYYFSAVPILFLYSTSTAPVLFQCFPKTHPSSEYEGGAERSVAGTLCLDWRLMAQPAESTCPQKKPLGATTNMLRFDLPRPETHSCKCSRMCRAPFLCGLAARTLFRDAGEVLWQRIVPVLFQYWSHTVPVLHQYCCCSTVSILLQYWSKTVSVLSQYCSAPVLLQYNFSAVPRLFQYCSSTAPVLLQYCFSTVSTLVQYCFSNAPVLFQCCSNTVPVQYQYCSSTISVLSQYSFIL